MSILDNNLIDVYQSMINFKVIKSDGTNTTLIGSSTITSNLNVNNNLIVNNSLSINSTLNVSSNTLLNNVSINTLINISGQSNINMATINSNLTVSGNTNLINLYSNNINISGNTLITNNGTINSTMLIMGSLYNNNSISINSLLNVLGSVYINGLLTINTLLNITNNSIFNNLQSNNLYISNNSIFNNNTTILNNLYISNNTILISNNTINSYLYAPSISNINKFISCNSNLNVVKDINLNNVQINSSLTIINNSIVNGIILNSSLNVSGDSILNNLSTNSNLYVSGLAIISNNVSINSNINISNNAILNNTIVNKNVSFNSSLQVNGNLIHNNMNIKGTFINILPEYYYNEDAYNNGVPLLGLFRTGGIVRICLDIKPIFIKLLGDNPINIYVGDIYTDPGINSIFMTQINSNDIITTNITSIMTSDIGEILTNNILISNIPKIINNIDTSYSKTVTITYTATTTSGLVSNQTRILNILSTPSINNIILSSNQKFINVNLSGNYYYSTYTIILNNIIVIPETVFNTNNIDISNLTSNNLSYIITIYLKNSNGTILISSSLTFNIDLLPPLITTKNPTTVLINNISSFNLYSSVNAIDLPSNNVINLTSSNILLIKDNNNNYIDIPNDGNLDLSNLITYTILYTITDSIGNNSIIPFILIVNDILFIPNISFNTISNTYIYSDNGITNSNINGNVNIWNSVNNVYNFITYSNYPIYKIINNINCIQLINNNILYTSQLILNNMNIYSIEIIINMVSDTGYFISKQYDGYNSYNRFGYYDNKIYWRTSNQSDEIYSTNTLDKNIWYHIMITYDSSTIKLYINGILNNSLTGNFNIINDNGSAPTVLGAWIGDGRTYSNLYICLFNIYNNSCLDSSNVLLSYNYYKKKFNL
jgi:predicted small secreted protein